jgi:hypothetical protein
MSAACGGKSCGSLVRSLAALLLLTASASAADVNTSRAVKQLEVSDFLKNPCLSRECLLFCNPKNAMRPGWCMYYLTPKSGYETLSLEEICDALLITRPVFCPPF